MNWLFCAKIRRRAFREKSENPRKNLQFCKKAVILYSMDNENSYAVGIDIGTDAVKVVIGRVDSSEDSVENSREISVIGVGVQKNLGMRKGVVTNLDKTAEAIDRALNSAERMSGAHVDRATVSINGSHISGLASSGVVAVMNNKPIDAQDIARVRDAATVVAIPANRQILDITSRNYKLDGQDNIRDPFGMTGIRLEVDAYIVTALEPYLANIEKTLEILPLGANKILPTGLASAESTLTDPQKDNGAVLVDIGGATTTITVFEDGDIFHTSVLPIGGNNITNDIAIGLKTDLEIAEKIKLQHAVAAPELRRGAEAFVKVKHDGRELVFETEILDDVVEARLAEIFELVNKDLKKIRRAGNLPGGAVLVGGSAKLRGIADYAREALSLNAVVGAPAKNFGGLTEQVADPSFATALGLLSADAQFIETSSAQGSGIFKRISSLFAKKK